MSFTRTHTDDAVPRRSFRPHPPVDAPTHLREGRPVNDDVVDMVAVVLALILVTLIALAC